MRRSRPRFLVLGILLMSTLASAAHAATPATVVDLGSSAPYAVLSGASIGNVVSGLGAPHTTVHGGLAVKPAADPLGFPPGIVTGASDVGNLASAQALADATAAYTEIAGRANGTPLAGALAGTTITPGLYTIAGAASNTTTATLDAGGNPNAYFVFQVGGALSFAASSHVVLAGGAQASHVFWQVNGAGAVGASATFAGTLIALNAGAVGAGTIVNGRVFALGGALTLDDNDIYAAPPSVTITGGANAYTTSTTPFISGTTDQVAPTVVTVTIDGQTLTATPVAGGAWSVAAPMLANGDYPITASAQDGASNTTTARQTLTVDTILPVVTIGSASSLFTNDTTPTIAGTSDVDPGSFVHVSVDTTRLTALVQSDHSWNITTSSLSNGSHAVSVSVSDPAGNVGTASQTITIDNVPPALTVSGGANALTNDATPTISGSAAVAPGTVVTVSLADQSLTGTVLQDGSYAATAAFLSEGPHRVIVDVQDDAGNETRFTQTLTIDTISPLVSIAGGASRSTTDVDPTITGTSDAPPGTVVTIRVVGQTVTTLVQANGSWNATPSALGLGSWLIVASVPDLAGNVGSASETITIVPPGNPTAEPPVAPTVVVQLPIAPLPITPAPTLPRTADPSPLTIDTPGVAAATVVAPDGSQRLAGWALSIGTRLTAPSGGSVVATLTGTVRIAGVQHHVALTRITSTLGAGHSTMLKLLPKGSKSAAKAAFATLKAAARSGKKVTATITIRIVDQAGHSRTVERIVTLT